MVLADWCCFFVTLLEFGSSLEQSLGTELVSLCERNTASAHSEVR